jgi:putative Ca2+/H+ antiporter (TMEM165/GDT1 family)
MVQAIPGFGETFDCTASVRPGKQCSHGHARRPENAMEAFLVSIAIVALAEMGDKTQLLSLVLAARFRRPVPIISGILAATLVNHACAGAVGTWIMTALGPNVLRWILGLSFLGMAIWMLIPDRLDEPESRAVSFGVFGTTVIAFFFTEMGDKTQVATIALAARYSALYAVVAGTTVGMMMANVPAVLLGDRVTRRVSIPLIHSIAALIFSVLGLMALLKVDSPL